MLRGETRQSLQMYCKLCLPRNREKEKKDEMLRGEIELIGNHCKRCLSRIRNSAALNCIGCKATCNNIRSLLSFVSPPQTKGFSPFHQVLPVPLIPYQKEILVGFKTDKDIFYGTRIHHGYVHCIFALLDVFSC